MSSGRSLWHKNQLVGSRPAFTFHSILDWLEVHTVSFFSLPTNMLNTHLHLCIAKAFQSSLTFIENYQCRISLTLSLCRHVWLHKPLIGILQFTLSSGRTSPATNNAYTNLLWPRLRNHVYSTYYPDIPHRGYLTPNIPYNMLIWSAGNNLFTAILCFTSFIIIDRSYIIVHCISVYSLLWL